MIYYCYIFRLSIVNILIIMFKKKKIYWKKVYIFKDRVVFVQKNIL